MTIDLADLLKSQPFLVMFLTLGLGYLLGNLEIRKFKLGATAGVLLVGMGFGHWGFVPQPELQQVGFILFIYCVGFQAGPRFFAVFAKDGKRYLILAAFVAALAIALAQTCQVLFKLPPGSAAGMLAGSLTSTPTLAAAQGSIASGSVALPAKEIEQLENNLTVSYALTYIYGLVGLMMLVRLVPTLLKINLPDEARKLEGQMGRVTDRPSEEEEERILTRAYEVTAPALIGHTLKSLEFRKLTGCLIERIKRNGAMIEPGPDTVLQAGDRITLVGETANAAGLRERIGPEVQDRELLTFQVTSCEVVVTRPEVTGRPLSELKLQRGGCFLTRIVRAHVPLPINQNVVLERGDIVQFSGARARLKELAAKFGHIEREVHQTDLLTMAFGIAMGIVIGQIAVQVGGWSLSLGMAGGLLLTGLLIGFLRSYQPTFGSMPQAARYVFTELGMMFFMANIGLSAGGGVAAAFLSVGPTLILCGVMLTTVPVVVGFLFGRYVLKLNPAVLLGALTGAMTSTPALGVVSDATKSSVPALGYAGTYTFANVFLTMAGTIIIRWC